MDDIEDLISEETEPFQRPEKTLVLPKRHEPDDASSSTKTDNGAFLPGKGTVYIKTWGCSHNNSDGEYMAGQLAEQGYTVSNKKEGADLWLLNSCTVKNPSQSTFLNAVQAGRDAGAKVVVAGCVPQGQPKHKDFDQLSIIGVQQIDRVVEVVEQTLQGNSVQLLGTKKTAGADLQLPKIRKNKFVEIIAINTGCLNQCTYCKTKHARGDLRSYPVADLIARVRQVLKEDIVEIWLTSEDTGAYGRDIGTDLPTLLYAIVKELPRGVMLRLGMTNPPYILEHLKDIAKILCHPQVYAFLHVPVQACADHVLFDMRRKYTLEDFERVVTFLQRHVPGMTIATDVICGFPTETEEDFEVTLAVMEKYKFPILHISQFYPRPGTPAARLKKLKTDEVKRRSRLMTDLFKSYLPYEHFVGARMRALFTDVQKDGKLVGHNKHYHQVLVPPEADVMGKEAWVEVVDTGKFYLLAKVLKGAEAEKAAREEHASSTVKADKATSEKHNSTDGDSLADTSDNTRAAAGVRQRVGKEVHQDTSPAPRVDTTAHKDTPSFRMAYLAAAVLVAAVGFYVVTLVILNQ